MMRRSIIAVLFAAAAAGAPGCVWYGAQSMTRLWADRNTLDRPAIFLETLSHAQPPRERVERIRWQYAAGPGATVVPPEQLVIMPPNPVVANPPADETVPPPAPPPEPAANSGERPRRRTNVAWLFGSSRG